MKTESAIKIERNQTHPGTGDFWKWSLPLSHIDKFHKEPRFEIFAGVWRRETGELTACTITTHCVFRGFRDKYDTRVATVPHWATEDESQEIQEAIAACTISNPQPPPATGV